MIDLDNDDNDDYETPIDLNGSVYSKMNEITPTENGDITALFHAFLQLHWLQTVTMTRLATTNTMNDCLISLFTQYISSSDIAKPPLQSDCVTSIWRSCTNNSCIATKHYSTFSLKCESVGMGIIS